MTEHTPADTATPERHDPITDYFCLDEFRDEAVCVCQLPDGHGEDWHECRCGSTWTEARCG